MENLSRAEAVKEFHGNLRKAYANLRGSKYDTIIHGFQTGVFTGQLKAEEILDDAGSRNQQIGVDSARKQKKLQNTYLHTVMR